MLIRVVYASATHETFSAAELAELLRLARVNNSRLGVSGLLLFHEGSFLQVLEGDAQVVDALYAKIAADPRHHQLVLLGRFEVEERAFADWSMGALELNVLGDPTLEGLSEFLRGGVLALQGDPELMRRTLNGFRDGRYRRHVR